jgi:type VI secretion system protein ImpE
MATARELFQAGKLNQAIEALSAELRDNPADEQRRTFLFELLCFAGNWDRADKQLDMLAGEDPDRRIGALAYRAALAGERTREDKFKSPEASDESPEPAPVSGTLNGKPFESLEDADPRIGARLEVLAGEYYIWLPLHQIVVLEVDPPKRLRDLLWAPARIEAGPAAEKYDLGQVLLPVLSPLSGSHADDAVRLGRVTVWESMPDGLEIPCGQKLLLVDGEEVPLLEVRRLEIAPAAA